jgi:hypothetical protein
MNHPRSGFAAPPRGGDASGRAKPRSASPAWQVPSGTMGS